VLRLDVRKTFAVAGIRELVQVHDFSAEIRSMEKVLDKVRANESGSSRYEDVRQLSQDFPAFSSK
jgi:hypothetical protein